MMTRSSDQCERPRQFLKLASGSSNQAKTFIPSRMTVDSRVTTNRLEQEWLRKLKHWNIEILKSVFMLAATSYNWVSVQRRSISSIVKINHA